MAQGLRPRPLGPRTGTPRPATARASAAALLALVAACADDQGQTPPPPAPRAVDVGAIADGDLVAAVLDECHRPLQGALDRLAATVRLPDGTEVRLFAELPDKLRMAAAADRFLLVDGAVTRLGDPPTPATPAETERVRRFATLLDAAALGPLHRATGCRRLGPSEFELAQPKGGPWRVRLRTGTLLPEQLDGPGGAVRVLDWLRTSSTWMTARAEIAGLGACALRFELANLTWDDDFFAPTPTTGPADRKPALQLPLGGGAEPRSPVPFLVDGKAARWVVLDDPRTWSARAAAYQPVHAELARQGQQIAGFPMLLADGERLLLAVPFRQRQGGPAFATPAGWTIRDVPAGRWLVVYPPAGDLDARVAAGARLLRDALAQQDLQANGAIVAQPFFHLHEGEPDAAKLGDPTVRMSVPVR